MTMTKFSRINKQREEITMRVLEDMEKGGNEWKKPWVEASLSHRITRSPVPNTADATSSTHMSTA